MLGPGMATEVEVRLVPDGYETVLELKHTTPADVLDELVRSCGPGGNIGVGAGWDITLFGLQLHLDVATWECSQEVVGFAIRSCPVWGQVVQDAWNVDDDTLDAAIAFATSNFAPGTDR